MSLIQQLDGRSFDSPGNFAAPNVRFESPRNFGAKNVRSDATDPKIIFDATRVSYTGIEPRPNEQKTEQTNLDPNRHSENWMHGRGQRNKANQ
jgi:hypothetical protein